VGIQTSCQPWTRAGRPVFSPPGGGGGGCWAIGDRKGWGQSGQVDCATEWILGTTYVGWWVGLILGTGRGGGQKGKTRRPRRPRMTHPLDPEVSPVGWNGEGGRVAHALIHLRTPQGNSGGVVCTLQGRAIIVFTSTHSPISQAPDTTQSTTSTTQHANANANANANHPSKLCLASF
jgi:hypothetical protein